MGPDLKFVIRLCVTTSSECRYGKICVGERVRIQINVADGQCNGQWKEVKEVEEGEDQDSRRIRFLATGVLKIEHSESRHRVKTDGTTLSAGEPKSGRVAIIRDRQNFVSDLPPMTGARGSETTREFILLLPSRLDRETETFPYTPTTCRHSPMEQEQSACTSSAPQHE
ncbi:hypothetical protein ALC56_13281 [Trachymyrmex septentrionalis]|uniref:Uncharacterized protein n=1 Tax=Trachymyrmex septentrionalis TaxID=34720 RepID=A0A195EX17_9HYME|nr:hypothetical protein ALC56_13281 [Trachymyrmex septentrionalis]